MQIDPGLSNRQVLYRLRKTDTVLTGKNPNQPLILYRSGHWLMITLSVLLDTRDEMSEGVRTLHSMSPARARKTVREWLPYSRLTPLDEVAPYLRAELAVKALAAAEDYRRLLEQGWVQLAGGFTSDTLHVATTRDLDLQVACIASWMEAGERGPFLVFERTQWPAKASNESVE